MGALLAILMYLCVGHLSVRTTGEVVVLSNTTKVCPAPSPCTCIFKMDYATEKNSSSNEINCSKKLWMSLPMLIPTEQDFRTINLSHNTIPKFPADYLNNITGVRIVDLSFNRLSKIPAMLSKLDNLTHLYLEENAIRLQPGPQFEGLSSLLFLELTHNRIPNLTIGMFRGLHNLTHLVLSDNKITEIEYSVFSDTPKLRFLYLTENDLTNITKGMFDGLPALEKLYLNENKVKLLGDECFSTLGSLTFLSLKSNEIVDVFPATFRGLGNVTMLSVSYNHIVHLPAGIFAQLDSLKELYLYWNEIEKIDANIFIGIEDTLAELYIGFNYLKNLTTEFSSLINLKMLALDGNPMTKLPHINGLSKLEELDIMATHVSTIYPCEIHSLENLEMIEWGMSPIHCDCSMRWMLRWVKDKEEEEVPEWRVRWEQFWSWICATPEALKGKEFDLLYASNLTCDDGMEPQWCRASQHLSLPLHVAEDKDAFYFRWALKDTLPVAVSCVKIKLTSSLEGETFEMQLPSNANSTVVSKADLHADEHYKACAMYMGTSNHVVVQNCTQFVVAGRRSRSPKAAIIVPIFLALLIGAVVVGVVIYRRRHPITKGRVVETQGGISGIENIGYGHCDLPGAVSMSQLEMNDNDLEIATTDI